MKTIHLAYVAMFREKIGSSGESIPTTAMDVTGLYDELTARYALPWSKHSIRPAVNDRITTWETALQDQDRVLFLPPSSGG
jgi:molybdopterin synthase sulfur carrier subunit